MILVRVTDIFSCYLEGSRVFSCLPARFPGYLFRVSDKYEFSSCVFAFLKHSRGVAKESTINVRTKRIQEIPDA